MSHSGRPLIEGTEGTQNTQDIEDSLDAPEPLAHSILGKHRLSEENEAFSAFLSTPFAESNAGGDDDEDDDTDAALSLHRSKRPRIDSDLDLERPSTDVLSSFELPHDMSSMNSPSADFLSLPDANGSPLPDDRSFPATDTLATDSSFGFFTELGVQLTPSGLTPVAAPAFSPAQQAMDAIPTVPMTSSLLSSSSDEPKPEEQKTLEIGKGTCRFKYLKKEGWVLLCSSLYKSLGIHPTNQREFRKETVFSKPLLRTDFTIKTSRGTDTRPQFYLNQAQMCQMLEAFGNRDRSLQKTIEKMLDSFEKNSFISSESRKKIKFGPNLTEEYDQHVLLLNIHTTKYQSLLHFARLGDAGWFVSFLDICKLLSVPSLMVGKNSRHKWLNKLGITDTRKLNFHCVMRECKSNHRTELSLDANQTARALDRLQKDYPFLADKIIKLKEALLIGTAGNYEWREAITSKKPRIEIDVVRSEASPSDAKSLQTDSASTSSSGSAASSSDTSREPLPTHLASPAVNVAPSSLPQHSPQQSERKFTIPLSEEGLSLSLSAVASSSTMPSSAHSSPAQMVRYIRASDGIEYTSTARYVIKAPNRNISFEFLDKKGWVMSWPDLWGCLKLDISRGTVSQVFIRLKASDFKIEFLGGRGNTIALNASQTTILLNFLEKTQSLSDEARQRIRIVKEKLCKVTNGLDGQPHYEWQDAVTNQQLSSISFPQSLAPQKPSKVKPPSVPVSSSSFFPRMNPRSTPTPLPVPGMTPLTSLFFQLPLSLMKARNPVGKSLPDDDVEMAPAGAPVPALARTSN